MIHHARGNTLLRDRAELRIGQQQLFLADGGAWRDLLIGGSPRKGFVTLFCIAADPSARSRLGNSFRLKLSDSLAVFPVILHFDLGADGIPSGPDCHCRYRGSGPQRSEAYTVP